MSRQLLLVLALAVLMAYFNSSSAQVTFSRDWNAGKRGSSDIQCGPSGRSAAAVCHMLLNELRQAIACESRSMLRSLQADEAEVSQPAIFTGRR